MKAHVYSVSQINGYIKRLFDNDIFLGDVFVEAEISNFKAHSAGHFYFTLKDERASLNAVMYRSNAENVTFIPENGMKVTVYGYISLYEKTGQYQIYVQIMEPTGKGALYAAFEQLKDKLEKEGLFDSMHKKPIPKYPNCIAVITSSTGAAIRDIIRISKRRNPNIKIVAVPALVQGENAAESICGALKTVNKWGKADIIILGRGGGSIEDLWCFNEESVARAIFKSKIPVISAVGHETDFTIADFTADVRASTPSAAAEIAVPEFDALMSNNISVFCELCRAMEYKYYEYRDRFLNAFESRALQRPLDRITDMYIYTDELQKKMYREMMKKIEKNKIVFEASLGRLESLSPVNVLKRGFSIVYKDNKPVFDVSDVSENDIINVIMKDGYIKSKVIEKGEADAEKEKF